MFNEQSQETPAGQEQQQGNANTQSTNSASPFDTMLSEIRNERGEQKYRSVEDGLNALKHSQEFIYKTQLEKRQLEDQLKELQAKADKVTELEATLQKLTQRGSEPSTQAPQINEETIANLVDTRLSAKQQEQVAIANQKTVVERLTSVYGEKAGEVFYEKASQIGLSREDIQSLSARSPKAVLTMFGLDGDVAPKQTNKSPATSRINSEHFQGKPSSYIGAESERVPLGGGERHYQRILDNSINMVNELKEAGMSVSDLTDPVNYMKYMKNKAN